MSILEVIWNSTEKLHFAISHNCSRRVEKEKLMAESLKYVNSSWMKKQREIAYGWIFNVVKFNKKNAFLTPASLSGLFLGTTNKCL